MEYEKKKKNGSRSGSATTFIILSIVLVIVLLMGFALLAYTLIAPHEDVFSQTVTAISGTNEAVGTRIMQTQIAATPR